MSSGDLVMDDNGRVVRMYGYVLPDLDKLPRDQWHEALRPLPANLDTIVQIQAGREIGAEVARVLREVRSPVYWRRRRLAEQVPPPDLGGTLAGGAAAPKEPPRRGVQLGLRLRRDDAAALERAALGLGMKRCELARALIVNGVRAILSQRAIAPAEARSRGGSGSPPG